MMTNQLLNFKPIIPTQRRPCIIKVHTTIGPGQDSGFLYYTMAKKGKLHNSI